MASVTRRARHPKVPRPRGADPRPASSGAPESGGRAGRVVCAGRSAGRASFVAGGCWSPCAPVFLLRGRPAGRAMGERRIWSDLSACPGRETSGTRGPLTGCGGGTLCRARAVTALPSATGQRRRGGDECAECRNGGRQGGDRPRDAENDITWGLSGGMGGTCRRSTSLPQVAENRENLTGLCNIFALRWPNVTYVLRPSQRVEKGGLLRRATPCAIRPICLPQRPSGPVRGRYARGREPFGEVPRGGTEGAPAT